MMLIFEYGQNQVKDIAREALGKIRPNIHSIIHADPTLLVLMAAIVQEQCSIPT